jgi:integrase
VGKPASGSRDFAKDGTVIVRISLGKGAPRISVPLNRLPGDPHVDWLQGAIVEHARTLFAAGTVTRDELAAELHRAARVTVGLDGAMLRPAWERMIRDGLVVKNITADRTVRAGKTFRDVAELWMAGKIKGQIVRANLSELHATLRNYIYDEIGHVPLEVFGVQHLEQVFESSRSAHLAQSTRVGHWFLAEQVISLAVHPLKLLKYHPIPRGARPKVQRHRIPATLWPTDDHALCHHTEVSVHDRIMFAYMAREGARVGEAWGLKWSGVQRMARAYVLRCWWEKTKQWGQWVASPGTAEGLLIYRARYWPDAKPNDLVFHPSFPRSHAALHLRDYLKQAKFEDQTLEQSRPELFERGNTAGDPNHIDARGLRALFVTLAIARGESDAYVREHTGHESESMIKRYTRNAELFRAAGWLALPGLDESLPELAIATDVRRLLPPRHVVRGELSETIGT